LFGSNKLLLINFNHKDRRDSAMNFEERLDVLKHKHGELDIEIDTEKKRPLPNDMHIHNLKKQKLFLKDKITDLSS